MSKKYPVYTVKIGQLEKKYVNDCLCSGWISSAGKYIDLFEKEFAKFIGVKYAVATNNGTSALHLLLLSAGVSKDDEVIVPDYTFISTALAVSYIGAKPVFVDVEKDDWNLDAGIIEKVITKRTKAILPVHIYGIPAKMEKINEIGKKYNLLVLEDAAEALGAEYLGKKVGNLSDGAIFSFYGNKTITTGEGGMIVTNSDEIYNRARSLRDYGRDADERYTHKHIGYNYRMSNIAGALGLGQITRVSSIIRKKESIKNLYMKLLSALPGINFQSNYQGSKDGCWLVSVLLEPKKFGMEKNALLEFLSKNGIDTRSFFLPLHKQPIYNQKGNFPVSDSLFKNGFSLPSYPTLSPKDIDYICNTIKSAYDYKKIK